MGTPMPSNRGELARSEEQRWFATRSSARERTGRRVSEIKARARRHDEQALRGLPRRGWDRRGAGGRPPPRRRRLAAPTSTTGARSSTRTCWAIELGYMLDNAEATVVSAIERKESRGAQFRTDFPERDDDEWLKHIDISRSGDGAPDRGVLRGDDHPVGARGEEVLMPDVPAEDPPLRPGVRRGRLLGGLRRRARRPPLGARGHPRRSGTRGRLDRHPLLLPRSDLRLLRREASTGSRSWPATPTSPTPCGRGARRGDRGRADGQHARAQGPDRGHGRRPLEEGPAGGARGCFPRGSLPSASTSWTHEAMVDVTQSMACIQCGACVSACLSHGGRPADFIGPAALAKAYRFVGDPRDDQHRGAAPGPRRGPARASTTARTASPASRCAPRTWPR